jgi:hypothetical protein
MGVSGTAERAIACILVLAVGGCTVERSPQFYPVNPAAQATGVLTGKFVGHGRGHGTLTIDMPDGEKMSGQYSVVFGGTAMLGTVFASAYGPGGAASGVGQMNGLSISNSGQGMADVAGSRGTTMHCEFLNSNFTGHGYGGCQTSKGAIYRLVY